MYLPGVWLHENRLWPDRDFWGVPWIEQSVYLGLLLRAQVRGPDKGRLLHFHSGEPHTKEELVEWLSSRASGSERKSIATALDNLLHKGLIGPHDAGGYSLL